MFVTYKSDCYCFVFFSKEHPDRYSESSLIILAVFIGLMSVFGILANGTTIYVIYNSSKLRYIVSKVLQYNWRFKKIKSRVRRHSADFIFHSNNFMTRLDTKRRSFC